MYLVENAVLPGSSMPNHHHNENSHLRLVVVILLQFDFAESTEILNVIRNPYLFALSQLLNTLVVSIALPPLTHTALTNGNANDELTLQQSHARRRTSTRSPFCP